MMRKSSMLKASLPETGCASPHAHTSIAATTTGPPAQSGAFSCCETSASGE
jgi:hypothetical protein